MNTTTTPKAKKEKGILFFSPGIIKIFDYLNDSIIVSLHFSKEKAEYYVRMCYHYDEQYYEVDTFFKKLDLAEVFLNRIDYDSIEYIVTGGTLENLTF